MIPTGTAPYENLLHLPPAIGEKRSAFSVIECVTMLPVRVKLGLPRSKNQWILALLGAAVTIGCAIPLAQGVLSLFWPLADGVIIHSREMEGERVIGVDIGYRYATRGSTYTGERFRFQFVLAEGNLLSRDVRSILGRYRVGEPVKIAFDPDNPQDSVLEPGPDPESVIPFVLGLFLLLLGLGDVPKDKRVQQTSPWPVPARPRYGLAKTFAVAGVALFLLGAYYLYHGISSLQWPSVEGRILNSQVHRGSPPETVLWYEYHVGNQRYLASSYRNGGNGAPFLKFAESTAARYPVGRVVPVYYNPRNPQDALLEPGLWWGNFVTPALALLLLGLAWVAKKYAEIRSSRGTRTSSRY